jgi:hypothetical protein
VGQVECFVRDVTKSSPWDLFASSTKAPSVYFLSIGLQSATPGSLEEFTRFDLHALALSTGGKGENEGNALGEGKLSVASKILG